MIAALNVFTLYLNLCLSGSLKGEEKGAVLHYGISLSEGGSLTLFKPSLPSPECLGVACLGLTRPVALERTLSVYRSLSHSLPYRCRSASNISDELLLAVRSHMLAHLSLPRMPLYQPAYFPIPLYSRRKYYTHAVKLQLSKTSSISGSYNSFHASTLPSGS